PEAIYSRKGGKTPSGKITLAYIEFPLLAKFSIPTTTDAKPALFLGPSVGLNFSCSLNGLSGDVQGNWDCAAVGSPVNTVEYSIVGGGGVDLGRLGLFARYQFGLSNVDATTNPSNAKNRVVTLGVRYSLSAPRY